MVGICIHLMATLASFCLGLAIPTVTTMPMLLSSIMKQTDTDRISTDATNTISVSTVMSADFLDDIENLRDAAFENIYTENKLNYLLNLFENRHNVVLENNGPEVEPKVPVSNNIGISIADLKLLDNSLKMDSSGVRQSSLKNSYIKRSGREFGSLSTRLALQRRANILAKIVNLLKFRLRRKPTGKRLSHYKRYSVIDSLASGLIGM